MLDEVRRVVLDDQPLSRLIGKCRPSTARILDCALAHQELSENEGEHLLNLEGEELTALVRAADTVRAADVGAEVTYVLNRNVNWTNICYIHCEFCAFARRREDEDAYEHSTDDILNRIQEAVEMGATEVCLQAGINPAMDPFAYRDLLAAIKKRFPSIHLHAFSPMEIMYGARRTKMSFRDYLLMLKEAGLGSIPGTAAEILDDDVRKVLCNKKIDVGTWVEIVSTAHSVGVRSSSTIMYGHMETPRHIVRHLALLRSIQKETGGFTEFVPLRFIHEQTPLYQSGHVGKPPPTGVVDLRMYAFARLLLRGWIDNVQTSWVKLGPDLAQLTLLAGCNDFGGTLMEESITRSAGGGSGEYLSVNRIRELIAGIGRIPVERTTTYGRPSSSGTPAPGNGAGRRSGSGTVSPWPALAS
jgi:FO synthase